MRILKDKDNLTKEEWLKLRSKGIGGSYVSVICGVSKHKSPFQLWIEKTNNLIEEANNKFLYWGTVLEPIIREEFSNRTGMKVKICNNILQHKDYDYMLANIDGIAIDKKYGNCIFEAKTASAYKVSEWNENNIPFEYQLQVQHYMSVTGFRGAYIAVLIGGNDFRWYFIERDAEVINYIIKVEKHFWELVKNNTPPSIDGSDSAKAFLNKLYSSSKVGSEVILPNEIITLVEEYKSYLEEEKICAKAKEESANKIKLLMGENEIAKCVDSIIIWKNVISERLDTKKLNREFPELYSKFTYKASYRKFLIK